MDFDRLLTSSAATANTSSIRTMSTTLADVERAIEALRQMAPAAPPRVRESPYAMQTVPARVHKKRRNQSDAYHQRVQKKWVKRWGTKQVPGAYMIDAAAIGGSGKILVVHPALGMAALESLDKSCRDSPQDTLKGGIRDYGRLW